MPPKAKTTTANTRSVKWCYTLNNPVQPVPWNELTQVYHVYGEEIGENGTPHYQGFIIFKNRRTFNQMKEINPWAHWDMAKLMLFYVSGTVLGGFLGRFILGHL